MVAVAAGASPSEATGAADVRTIHIIARDNYFSPRYIPLPAKRGVDLEVANRGADKHAIFVAEWSIFFEILPGETKTVRIAAVEAGVYDFLCPYHETMRGTVEVKGR